MNRGRGRGRGRGMPAWRVRQWYARRSPAKRKPAADDTAEEFDYSDDYEHFGPPAKRRKTRESEEDADEGRGAFDVSPPAYRPLTPNSSAKKGNKGKRVEAEAWEGGRAAIRTGPGAKALATLLASLPAVSPLINGTFQFPRALLVISDRNFASDETEEPAGERTKAREKVWTFPTSHYVQVHRALEKSGYTLQDIPEEVKEFVRKVEAHKAKAPEPVDFSKVGSDLIRTLLPFQIRGLHFAMSNGGRVMIGDEMGLGKTIQAIAIACAYRDEWPLLVIVPASLRTQWAREFQRWVPEASLKVLATAKDQGLGAVNIVSYSLLPGLKERMKAEGWKFGVLIADESHYLKSNDAERTRVALPLFHAANRRILLSGTPALSRPAELFPQLRALGLSIFPTLHAFGMRYCAAYEGPYGWDYSGASHVGELHYLLRSVALIRRLKREVLTDLPHKLRQLVHIDADEEAVNRIATALRKEGGKRGFGKEAAEKEPELMQLWAQTGEAKLSAVWDYVHALLDTSMDAPDSTTSNGGSEAAAEAVPATPGPSPAGAVISSFHFGSPTKNRSSQTRNAANPSPVATSGGSAVFGPMDDGEDFDAPAVASPFKSFPTPPIRQIDFSSDPMEVDGGEEDATGAEDGLEDVGGGEFSQGPLRSSPALHSDGHQLKYPKFLVFAHHTAVLDYLQANLDSQGVGYIRIDGSTPVKSRAGLVDQFSSLPRLRVALLSLTAASSGLNLAVASLVVFAELYWNPGLLLQAEDRAHRIGQKAAVVEIRYLLAARTVDDLIWPLVERKLSVVGAAIDGTPGRDLAATRVGAQASLAAIVPYATGPPDPIDDLEDEEAPSKSWKRKRTETKAKGAEEKKKSKPNADQGRPKSPGRRELMVVDDSDEEIEIRDQQRQVEAVEVWEAVEDFEDDEGDFLPETPTRPTPKKASNHASRDEIKASKSSKNKAKAKLVILDDDEAEAEEIRPKPKAKLKVKLTDRPDKNAEKHYRAERKAEKQSPGPKTPAKSATPKAKPSSPPPQAQATLDDFFAPKRSPATPKDTAARGFVSPKAKEPKDSAPTTPSQEDVEAYEARADASRPEAPVYFSPKGSTTPAATSPRSTTSTVTSPTSSATRGFSGSRGGRPSLFAKGRVSAPWPSPSPRKPPGPPTAPVPQQQARPTETKAVVSEGVEEKVQDQGEARQTPPQAGPAHVWAPDDETTTAHAFDLF